MGVKKTMAVILAGGEGERLSILSSVRAKPAVPFGGKYRIIDFALSNCVNSGIDDVAVLTQYAPHSLMDHIGLGRPWDLDRNHGGVKLLQPYLRRGRVAEWYRGTADAVLQNMTVIDRAADDIVLILAGDHIYKMDYQPFIAAHKRKRADVTIAAIPFPVSKVEGLGLMGVGDDLAIQRFAEKTKDPAVIESLTLSRTVESRLKTPVKEKHCLASMGIYLFNRQVLAEAEGDVGERLR